MNKTPNLTGQRFGRLVVQGLSDQKDKWGKPLHNCLCDCGNRCLVTTSQLKSGNTKSCGCLSNDNRKTDITGQRFGRLVALYCTGEIDDSVKGHNSYVWVFRCDCGNECKFPLRSMYGGRESCGCAELENKRAQVIAMQDHVIRADGTNVSNIRKMTVFRNNTSGVRGVHWKSRNGKWRAVLDFKGKRYELGMYKNFEDAVNARRTAEEQIIGTYLKNFDAGGGKHNDD